MIVLSALRNFEVVEVQAVLYRNLLGCEFISTICSSRENKEGMYIEW